MRYTTFLRRRSQEGRIPLETRDWMAKVAGYIESLETALRETRVRHADGCVTIGDPPDCTCDAIHKNIPLANLLEEGEMDSQKRKYRRP